MNWYEPKEKIGFHQPNVGLSSQPGIFHWTNEHWSILSSTGKNWRRSPKSSCLHTVVHHLCASLQVGSLSLEAFLACISNSQDVKRTILLVGNLFSQHVFRLTALRVCPMIYSYNYTYSNTQKDRTVDSPCGKLNLVSILFGGYYTCHHLITILGLVWK